MTDKETELARSALGLIAKQFFHRWMLIQKVVAQIESLKPHDKSRLESAARELIRDYTDEEVKKLLNDNSEEEWFKNPMLLVVVLQRLEIEDAFIPSNVVAITQ